MDLLADALWRCVTTSEFQKNASFDVEDEPTQLKPSLGRDGSEGWRVVWGLLPGCECIFAMKDKQWETIVRNTM